MLRQEVSLTQNVKSRTTRHNVLDALEKIINHLRVIGKTPENGLVVFCGNVSEKEGQSDIELWSLEPPQPLSQKIYWCDQKFKLDPIKDMIREKEVYGLIVLDTSGADIGFLKGKKIILQKHIDSLVPGKTRKGGWCVHENTLIQLENGKIIPIRDLKKEKLLCYDLEKNSIKYQKHHHYFERKSNSAYRLITKAPTLDLILTPEHIVFTLGKNGLITKQCKELEIGEYLFSVKKIDINSTDIDFPKDFFRCLGYFLGDGNKEKYRITISENEKNLAEKYEKIIKRIFKANTYLRFRENKKYWQLRIYNKRLLNLINTSFSGILNPIERKIPDKITMLPNHKLSGFISGLFDAEGYVDKKAKLVGITMKDEFVIRKLQLLLLRYGIISSLRIHKDKNSFSKNKKYTLRITDLNSLKIFRDKINFSSRRKIKELNLILKGRKKRSYVDQIPINGSYILKLANSINMNTSDFPIVQDFFFDKKGISYDIFKKQIFFYFQKRFQKLKDLKTKNIRKLRQELRIKQHELATDLNVSTTTICNLERDKTKNNTLKKNIYILLENKRRELLDKTEKIIDFLNNLLNSNLIITKIKKIEKIKPEGIFYDIDVPKYRNFVANGILVHNSQQRYSRIREEAKHEHLKKTGEIATSILKQEKDLKGILIGGPGPIKEKFNEGDFLDYQLKQKVLGVVDTSYIGDQGLQELVKRGENLLQEASVVKERKLMELFFKHLQKDDGLSIYGLEETKKAIESGAVDILLISEDFNWKRMKIKCQCGFQMELDTKTGKEHKCPKCGGTMIIETQQELSDILAKQAKELGSKVEIISSDSREGAQFAQLGGIGAILRYRID
ncbi:MAG: hypothetical protein J7J93_01955 [Candidatus Aenigmarchaeota archaeon]|nr:hypothetical protein [Candidatus Aenigmarchaeota archaeon]